MTKTNVTVYDHMGAAVETAPHETVIKIAYMLKTRFGFTERAAVKHAEAALCLPAGWQTQLNMPDGGAVVITRGRDTIAYGLAYGTVLLDVRHTNADPWTPAVAAHFDIVRDKRSWKGFETVVAFHSLRAHAAICDPTHGEWWSWNKEAYFLRRSEMYQVLKAAQYGDFLGAVEFPSPKRRDPRMSDFPRSAYERDYYMIADGALGSQKQCRHRVVIGDFASVQKAGETYAKVD